MTAAEIFKEKLRKDTFHEIFEKYIEGRASRGVDGQTAEQFKLKLDLEVEWILKKVESGSYRFTPYREKLISKGANSNPRQISVPTVRDKLVLRFLTDVLTDVFPESRSKPPHDYIKKIHEYSSNVSLNPDAHYLRLDVQSFYPSIDHKILLKVIRRKVRKKELINLIEGAIKTPTGVTKKQCLINERGVPQGLSISNILAAIYLHDIDQKLMSRHNICYSRFVDDILIIGSKSDVDELSEELPKLIKSKKKLTLHPLGVGNKSSLEPVHIGVDYLGYHICGKTIEVRKTSFRKMYSNLMKIFTAMKHVKKRHMPKLIWRLNLSITGCVFEEKRVGWLFFFAQSKNTRQLENLDDFVQKTISNIDNVAIEDLSRVKKFRKAYREIRHNFNTSRYYINFDTMSDEEKRNNIKVLLPHINSKKLDDLIGEELQRLFKKCVAKEVYTMERDLLRTDNPS